MTIENSQNQAEQEIRNRTLKGQIENAQSQNWLGSVEKNLDSFSTEDKLKLLTAMNYIRLALEKVPSK